MKKLFSVIISLCMLLGLMTIPAEQVSAAGAVLTGKSAMEISKLMGMGWNLGNSFDATGKSQSGYVYSHETSWGNPQITETLIKGVKAAGFNTIRIPVTWYTEMDSNYKINSAYMNRVKEVVNMAINQGMFVILNVHHENWVNSKTLPTTYKEIGYELSAVWSQIADSFASYDQHLIFEGMNEPRKAGASDEWIGEEASYQAVNYLNSVFVTTVRNNKKGYNSERCLMVPQYAASSTGSILNAWAFPTAGGNESGNIMVSVHSYAPYDFCLADTKTTFNPASKADTEVIDTLFENLDNLFLSKGIPVVIGETSATNSGNNTAARAAWAKYMGQKSAGYGVPIVIWDNGVNGTSGGECHSYINRTTGAVVNKTVIDSFFEGYKSVTYGSSRKKATSSASIIGGSTIWNSASGVKGTAWNTAVTIAASSKFFVEGRDIAIIYKGGAAPHLVLDSERKQLWWMDVAPTKTGTTNGYSVAYFSKADIDKVLNANKITDYGDLRNMMVVPTDSSTIYEVAQSGTAASITSIANGKIVSVGSKLPADPSFANMVFEGWYTTSDYKEGTKYTGGKTDGDITVYAKLSVLPAALNKNVTLPFVDIAPGDFYIKHLEYTYTNGIIKGLDATHFGPNEKMSRAMVVTILYRVNGQPEVSISASPFPDVPYKTTAWYFRPIAWAKENKVVGGYANGSFGPDDNITRQDFIKILYSYAKALGKDVSVNNPDAYKAVADYGSVSDYAVTSMNWGYVNGLIGSGSPLNPKGTLTRAEAVTIISRFLQK